MVTLCGKELGLGVTSGRSRLIWMDPTTKSLIGLQVKLACNQSITTTQCGLLGVSRNGSSLLATTVMDGWSPSSCTIRDPSFKMKVRPREEISFSPSLSTSTILWVLKFRWWRRA